MYSLLKLSICTPSVIISSRAKRVFSKGYPDFSCIKEIFYCSHRTTVFLLLTHLLAVVSCSPQMAFLIIISTIMVLVCINIYRYIQECIPVGCVPSAAVAVSPTTHTPLPCNPHHACPPAMHAPSPHTPLPCTSSATHAPPTEWQTLVKTLPFRNYCVFDHVYR